MTQDDMLANTGRRKSLLIGGSDTYTWKDLKNWVVSIRATGYDGDIALVLYRTSEDVIEGGKQHGVILLKADHDEFGQPLDYNASFGNKATVAHLMRWFHINQFLEEVKHEYQYVMIIDVSDVIFQTNPDKWLYDHEIGKQKLIVAPAEGIQYEKEEWNIENLRNGYGPYIYERYKHMPVLNGGTSAGTMDAMRNMTFLQYFLGKHKAYPPDQSGFNVIIHTVFQDTAYITTEEDAWAAQLEVSHAPAKHYLRSRMTEPVPVIHPDGTVTNSNGKLYCMVHQYNRLPDLKRIIDQRYENS